MNDLEEEIEYLLGWYAIKRKYFAGIVLMVIGIVVLLVDLLVLSYLIPNRIVYSQNRIIYDGDLIRLYVGITMGGIGGLFLLMGLPLLFITIKKKKKL
ncbi:hypothetical protein LCGC14_0907100 [marine sediment metagenome]|uniref:Uncharacterized protein n=1 Tax=marine sediment metagenome TaxID=412755 RepID=A0A0F9NZD7_9ZZZZ|nr:hypothetical protein [archaeon]